MLPTLVKGAERKMTCKSTLPRYLYSEGACKFVAVQDCQCGIMPYTVIHRMSASTCIVLIHWIYFTRLARSKAPRSL